MGVTAQEAAISAMVNWRASYMRRAFPISSGVILGFRPPLRAAGAGGGEPGLSAFTDEGGLVRGHLGEHPEHEGAVRGGGVDQSVAQRPDPDPAGLQGGDDVDEVAQVAAKPVDPPDDQGVARALSLCLVVIGVRVAQRAQARAWGQHREAVAAQPTATAATPSTSTASCAARDTDRSGHRLPEQAPPRRRDQIRSAAKGTPCWPTWARPTGTRPASRTRIGST